MKLFHICRSEINEFVAQLIRWFPGRSGFLCRLLYYRGRLAHCGKNITISEGCYLCECKNISLGERVALGLFTQLYAGGEGTESIQIGDDVTLTSHVMINADFGGHISIGRDCLVGPNVVFRTSNHICESRSIPIKRQGHNPGEITLEEDVWIGANSSIVGNITIGKGAIIGAGAVVTKDVEEYTIVAGVPARKIGVR